MLNCPGRLRSFWRELLNKNLSNWAEFADVSVIIPAYQSADTIGRALRSVAAQTLKPREVIVVDDGSTDSTRDAALAVNNDMNNVDLLVTRQDNAGAGAARNTAISRASGEFIAFLDADDEWLPRKISCSLEQLQQRDNRLVAHNGFIVENNNEIYLDIAARFRAVAKNPFPAFYRRGFISTSSVVTRRRDVLAVGGFDETLIVGQDFDLWLKLLSTPGTKFQVFDEALTRYHISPESITSRTRQRLINTLDVADRHAKTLRSHSRFPLFSVWFRIFAVHWEAIASYVAVGRPWNCLPVLVGLPAQLSTLTLKYLRRGP